MSTRRDTFYHGEDLDYNGNYSSKSSSAGKSSTISVSSTNNVKTSATTNGMSIFQQEKSRPRLAFKYSGMEYWGSSHSSLDDISYSSSDLIVNAFGTPYIPRPFIKSAPKWISLEDYNGDMPSQIIFDWKDFSVPPQSINIDFWEGLIEQSSAEGIKRIVVCCGAGLGRTGTALAALMLASGHSKDPEDAIYAVRNDYDHRAIETKQQEIYIWKLVMPNDKIPIAEILSGPRKSCVKGQTLLDDDSEDSIYKWNQTNRK